MRCNGLTHACLAEDVHRSPQGQHREAPDDEVGLGEAWLASWTGRAKMFCYVLPVSKRDSK